MNGRDGAIFSLAEPCRRAIRKLAENYGQIARSGYGAERSDAAVSRVDPVPRVLCARKQEAGVMLTVLVVEDDTDIRDLLCHTLGRAGYMTRVESDGRAALTAIHRDPPDIVLLDVGLPGMSGIEVCRELRGASGSSGPPIVLLSGHVRATDIEHGLAAGANEYVTKPFSPRRLIENLAQIRAEAASHPGVGASGSHFRPRSSASRLNLAPAAAAT